MLSRIADSLFWLNRYMERADGMTRLIHVHYILSMDKSMAANSGWKSVLEIYTTFGDKRREDIGQDMPIVLKQLLIDDNNPNSLQMIIRRARENARGAQDQLTKEVWEQVNQMYHMINDPSLKKRLNTNEAMSIIEGFSKETVVFAGITDITMERGLGWNFMNLGKFIERCMQTIAILGKELELVKDNPAETNDVLQWRYLLLCLSGYEMHLKNYRNQHHEKNVMHQVLLNENFPHSVIYSLTRINYYLENIRSIHEEDNRSLVRNFGSLFSKVKYMDLEAFNTRLIHDFLLQLGTDLGEFTRDLSQYYFNYS